MKKAMFDIVFPMRCPICLDIALPKGKKICDACVKYENYIKEPRCKKCGKQLIQEEIEYCYDCTKHRRSFEQAVALLDYSLPWVRRVLTEIKYRNHRQYLDVLCEELIKIYKTTIMGWNCEAIIPVPIHPVRRKMRGFNQTEEIAVRLEEACNIPVDCTILRRIKKTLPQKELNHQQRMENLIQAFTAEKMEHPYHTVLLVDDIFTTGSTAEACTRTLQSIGISTVYVLTLAVGRGIV